MTDILMKNNRLPMYNGDFVLTNAVDEIKQHIASVETNVMKNFVRFASLQS